MRVCFIAGTLGRGGAERQLIYMLQALQNAGVHARVLCLTKEEALEKEIEDLGIEVEWVGSSRSRIVRLLKIIANLRNRPVDIVQSSHFYTNIYAAAAGRILRINSIGAIRNDLISEIVANGIYGKWQLKLPRHLLANSNSALSRAEEIGVKRRNVHFLRNAVMSQQTRETTNGVDGEPKRINIVFVGRLVSQKRPERFVRLASELVRRMSEYDLTFEMVGDGPLRTILELMVSKSDVLDDRFSFLGNKADMNEVYRHADILVLTSEHEGTPNVILEAMAHGIPVVATNVGGVPEILTAERGILVDKSDFDGLCSAANKLIKDPELRHRLGRNGQKYVAENHSLPYLEERLIGIYTGLIAGVPLNG